MSLQNRMAAIVKRASAEADIDNANKRWARRKPSQTPAKILFDGITTPFECLVKDISSTGVQVEICKTKFNMDASSDAIPHYFTLIIPLDKTAVECQSMWRRGPKLGARFVGMVRTLSAPRPVSRKVVKK
jgi:hypothetical protein